MISYDFAYYRPTSIEEAINQFQDLRSQQKTVIYYGGGTEFISRARRNELNVDAVIDLKYIPDCNILKKDQDKVVFGSTTTLTEVANSNFYPLLTEVIRKIATQTERNKITIGGNLASHLPNREALMPFLLSDSQVAIAGKNGTKIVNMNDIFNNGFQLEDGEFIVKIITKQKFTTYPYFNSRQTKQSRVNYPIVSLAAMKIDNQIRVACSGVCHFPFRLSEIETTLNHPTTKNDKVINQAINHLPAPLLDDLQASAPYRKFVFKNALTDLLVKTGSN